MSTTIMETEGLVELKIEGSSKFVYKTQPVSFVSFSGDQGRGKCLQITIGGYPNMFVQLDFNQVKELIILLIKEYIW